MTLNERFRAVVNASGRRSTWLPMHFVEAWEFFVRQVVDSYWGDSFEYANDLEVRDLLERALQDDQLFQYEGWSEMCESIRAADERLREVLARGPLVRPGEPWWRARLPPYGGEDFVDEMFHQYGVKLEVVR